MVFNSLGGGHTHTYQLPRQKQFHETRPPGLRAINIYIHSYTAIYTYILQLIQYWIGIHITGALFPLLFINVGQFNIEIEVLITSVKINIISSHSPPHRKRTLLNFLWSRNHIKTSQLLYITY